MKIHLAFLSFRSPVRVSMISSNNTTLSVENWKAFKTSNYLIIFIIVIMLLGIVGNLHTILVYWFYYKKNKIRNFVLTLSAVDMLSCCSIHPYFVYMFSNAYHQSVFACTIHSLLPSLILFSYGLLTVIAIDRFRMILTPLAKQLSYSQSKVVCVMSGVCGLIMMVPIMCNRSYAQNIEFNHETNLTFVKKQCKVHDVLFDNIYSPMIDAYIGACIVLSFVMYVALFIFLRIKSRGVSVKMGKYCCQPKYCCCLKENYAPKASATGINRQSSTQSDNTGKARDSAIAKEITGNQQWNNQINYRRKNFVKGMRTSLVFLVVTMVSCLMIVPNVILTTAKVDRAVLRLNIHDWVDFLVVVYLTNHTVNPIIYMIVDSKFRKRSTLFYKSLCKPCTFRVSFD